ncbi:MAG: tetratricopeptide repeat protein [Bacteroidales bacterium]|nr:tetratricopeptide repeat protein [Bacteroidales bacterium]
MKKLLLTLIVTASTMGFAAAQDLGQVTELYNAAAALLSEDKKVEALAQFEQALEAANALGAEGAEVANNCKGIIPDLYLSIAKGFANENNLPKAIELFTKTAELAKNYGKDAVAAEAESLIANLKNTQLLANANALLNAKQFAEAAAAYKEITDMDPTNGVAFLRQGMALSNSGSFDEAITCLEKAQELFAEDAPNLDMAKKQLSNAFLRKANVAFKAKNWKDALEFAQKSAENNANNPSAQKIIGNAASQLKQNKVAAEAFEAYLALSPNAKDKVQTMYQLGTALAAIGDNAKACGYFKEIAQDEKFGEAARYQLTVLKCN